MTSPRDEVPSALMRRARFRMARNSAAVAAVVLVLVAGAFTGYRAFAGSGAEGPAGQPNAPAVHPTHSPSHHPAQTPTGPPSTPPESPQPPARSTAGRLQVTVAGSNGAAGSIQVEISMRNTGTGTCTLQGYPGMALLAGGTMIHTDVVRGSSVVVPPIHVRLVTLAPGAVASYVFGYSDVPTNGQHCPSSDGLEVTPPNAFSHAVVSLQVTACGGVLTTSPVFPGTVPPST